MKGSPTEAIKIKYLCTCSLLSNSATSFSVKCLKWKAVNGWDWLRQLLTSGIRWRVKTSRSLLCLAISRTSSNYTKQTKKSPTFKYSLSLKKRSPSLEFWLHPNPHPHPSFDPEAGIAPTLRTIDTNEKILPPEVKNISPLRQCRRQREVGEEREAKGEEARGAPITVTMRAYDNLDAERVPTTLRKRRSAVG